MLLYEIFNKLPEARRNPETNIKNEGHAAAVDFLKNKGRNMNDYGVSMTDLPKLGINPGSRYNTPVGIYFYPADYYVRRKDQGRALEFKDDAPYIQVFELTGNFEYIDEMTESVFTAYVKKLYKNAGRIGSYINKSEKETTDLLSRLLLEARSEAKRDSYGGWLWYILYSLGFYAGRDKRSNTPPRSAVVWNAILRLLGIDGLIDNGAGIIHENEPNQGVALDPRSIRHVNTFRNGPVPEDPLIEIFNDLANMYVGSYYVENVISTIKENNLKYNPKYKTQCNAIIEKCLNVLRDRPALYTRLSKKDIDALFELASKDDKQEMTVEFYLQKAPRVYHDLSSMVRDWQAEKSDPDWAARPDTRKAAVKNIIIEKYKVDQAVEIIRALTPYRSDSRVATVVTDLEELLARI